MAQLVERSAVNRQVLGSIPREGDFIEDISLYVQMCDFSI